MFKFGQSDNMGKYAKEKEQHELNGFVRAYELNNIHNKTKNNHYFFDNNSFQYLCLKISILKKMKD